MLSKSQREEYLGGALRTVCELMRSYGITKTAAEKQFRKALDAGYSRSIDSNSETRRISRLADVCTRWHIEKDFIDTRGQPKPLSWNGRTGGLLKLVARIVGPKDARAVANELVSRKLVKKGPTGAWLPKSKVVPPAGLDTAQILRSGLMIDRLLRTVAHNSELRYTGDVLLEVMAQVPRLPREEIANFKQFSKDQGVSFIRAVDDWLESRNLRRSRKWGRGSREAGVVAFAFLHPKRR